MLDYLGLQSVAQAKGAIPDALVPISSPLDIFYSQNQDLSNRPVWGEQNMPRVLCSPYQANIYRRDV